ncbi:hypothetical protein BaRGS_00038661, partial [Batillaria attramentaria]
DVSLGGGVEDVTETVQHCVMELVRETMETDVSAVRVTSLLHFALNAKTVITEQQRASLVVAVVTTPSVTRRTEVVLKDVLTVIAEICVTVAAPGFVGRAIAGGVVGGVVVVVAVPVLVVFIVFRKRKSRDASSPDDPNKQRTEEQRDNAWPVVNTERNKPGTCHPKSNYAYLDNFVNPDDITPYSSRHPANINTRGGTGNVLYQKTNIPCYKTYV